MGRQKNKNKEGEEGKEREGKTQKIDEGSEDRAQWMDPSSTVCPQLCLEVVVVPQEAMVVVLCCESLPSRHVLLGPLHHQSVFTPYQQLWCFHDRT